MTPDQPAAAAKQLRRLLDTVEARPDVAGSEHVRERHRLGAENLADYLALRRQDLRELQVELVRLGVSSLGRSEAHVRATIEAALGACEALAGHPPATADASGFDEGPRALDANATALLGPPPPERTERIMVTLPSSAADDAGALAGELIDAGMNCARINTAHDDSAAWTRMIRGVRAAAAARDRHCAVLVDLAGPKLRTGPFEEGPRAVRIRPTKDVIGRTFRPGRAVLVAQGFTGDVGRGPAIPVSAKLLAALVPGDVITPQEARGRRRTLRVVAVAPGCATVEVDRTTWLATDARLVLRATGSRQTIIGIVGELPPRSPFIVLTQGDRLILTADDAPTAPPRRGEVARIGCALPAAIDALRPGHRVEFDDGKIGAEVQSVDADAGEAVLLITRAGESGSKLRSEKGINLPDSDLVVDALSSDDLEALDTVGSEADIISLSFVRTPDDVDALREALARRSIDAGIVLKIETTEAFQQLPALLVSAMRAERAGVMIARGDLAVEAGFERTAELQEEILWACEAAHLPAIWATQVLESLAKDGLPSRAEISDAAMATRAECVMLNKGDHITLAVRTLDDILRRMAEHQNKKAPLLRQLRSW